MPAKIVSLEIFKKNKIENENLSIEHLADMLGGTDEERSDIAETGRYYGGTLGEVESILDMVAHPESFTKDDARKAIDILKNAINEIKTVYIPEVSKLIH